MNHVRVSGTIGVDTCGDIYLHAFLFMSETRLINFFFLFSLFQPIL